MGPMGESPQSPLSNYSLSREWEQVCAFPRPKIMPEGGGTVQRATANDLGVSPPGPQKTGLF